MFHLPSQKTGLLKPTPNPQFAMSRSTISGTSQDADIPDNIWKWLFHIFQNPTDASSPRSIDECLPFYLPYISEHGEEIGRCATPQNIPLSTHSIFNGTDKQICIPLIFKRSSAERIVFIVQTFSRNIRPIFSLFVYLLIISLDYRYFVLGIP